MLSAMKRPAIFLFVLSALFIPPLIGESLVNIGEALSDPSSLSYQILIAIRLPRIAFAFLTGAGLALIGAVFQALLRNDLATPYTLGVSSGGSLGAVIAIKSGLIIQIFGFSTVTLFSIGGSMLTIAVIYRIAGYARRLNSNTLILAGVTIGLFFSSLILFIHYMADFTETYHMVRWLMGSLSVSGWVYPLTLFIIFLPVFSYFYSKTPDFNILLASEEMALSKGVHVDRLQRTSFWLASFLVGSIVAAAGPIGFVGLIIPHILRLLLGADHRRIFPASVWVGGAFLVWCDTVARTIILPAELPVGIITSLFGGPFFIYLLVRRGRR